MFQKRDLHNTCVVLFPLVSIFGTTLLPFSGSANEVIRRPLPPSPLFIPKSARPPSFSFVSSLTKQPVMDIFPHTVSEGTIPYPLVHPAEKKNFEKINGSHNVEAFIPYLVRDMGRCKIIYQRLEWKQRVLRNFTYAGPKSHVQAAGLIPAEKYNWCAIETRFDKPVSEEKTRKDVRMAFKWDQNVFLVNRLFTFGFREVAPGTEHIYQLTRSPLILFNALDAAYRVGCAVQCFSPAYECHYNHWEMESGKCYRIEENVRYMIVAPAPCLFSLHIVKKGHPLPFQCVTADLAPKSSPPKNTSCDKKTVSRPVEKRPPAASSRKRRRCLLGDRSLQKPAAKQTKDNPPVYYFSSKPATPAAAAAAAATVPKPKSIPERIQELFHVARNFFPGARIEPHPDAGASHPFVPAATTEEVLNLCIRDVVGNEDPAPRNVDLLSQAFREVNCAASVHDESSVEWVIDESLPEQQQQTPAANSFGVTETVHESRESAATRPQRVDEEDERSRETAVDSNPPSEATTLPYDAPPSCMTNFSALEEDEEDPPDWNSIDVQPLSVASERGTLQTPYRTNSDFISNIQNPNFDFLD